MRQIRLELMKIEKIANKLKFCLFKEKKRHARACWSHWSCEGCDRIRTSPNFRICKWKEREKCSAFIISFPVSF